VTTAIDGADHEQGPPPGGPASPVSFPPGPMPRSPVGPNPSTDSELLRRLLRLAADRYALKVSEILLPRAGGSRTGTIKEPRQVEARQMVAAALRVEGWSWPRIGRALGYADHTAIMRPKRAAERRRCPCCGRLIY
jgi:hypothetical protein